MLESRSYIATPPGVTIKEQLDDRGMSQKEFASRMGLSEKHVSKLINGEVHLTPDVAERLEMVLGIPARFWNNLEAIYQEKLIKVKRENELDEEKTLAKNYPYSSLVDWGMVSSTNKIEEKIINLRKFFEVSNLKLLKNKDLMPIACRKLSDTEKSTYIMLTLAQYAKIKARSREVEPFCLNTLRNKIDSIRNLTTHVTMDFYETLDNILSSCGIAIVYLPEIKGSFLHGISFYDNNTNKVVIGITMRGKYADRFWFSLFHEIAHVIKGHIYKKNGTLDIDEREADNIAANILIPKENIDQFYRKKDYSIYAIKKFANSINVAVDIVIGRLQNDGKLKYNQFNMYKKKYIIN